MYDRTLRPSLTVSRLKLAQPQNIMRSPSATVKSRGMSTRSIGDSDIAEMVVADAIASRVLDLVEGNIGLFDQVGVLFDLIGAGRKGSHTHADGHGEDLAVICELGRGHELTDLVRQGSRFSAVG